MNREFLPEAIAGITIGLLLVVLAVYRTTKEPTSGVMWRAGVIGLLLYAVVAAGVLMQEGLTWFGLVVLLVLTGLPLLGMWLVNRLPRAEGGLPKAARALVAIGLTAAMLIAAGQTLATLCRVDPRTTVVVLAALTGFVVAAEGLRASGRIGSLAVWLLIVPIVICLALGVLLGNVGQAVSPIIVTPGLSWSTVTALVIAFLMIGSADVGLVASRRAGGWSAVRVLIGALVIVLLIVFGMLMFFGGAVLAPTVQFFVVPANLDALPGLAGVIVLVLTVLFAALVAQPLAGLRHSELGLEVRWFVVGAAAATVLALLDPGLDRVVIGTALVAAVLLATTVRGVQFGLIAAVVAIIVLALLGDLTWSSPAAWAIVAVGAVARLLSGPAPAVSASDPQPHEQPLPS